MERQKPLNYDVKFGTKSPSDWRRYEEPDPDDEELDKTPEDVVAILGFDPKKED